MFSSKKLCAALVAASLLSAPALAESIKVNGKTIDASLFDAFMAQQKREGVADTPELRMAVREELIRRELLMQEAQKKKFDKNPDVLAGAELARQGLVIQAFLNDYVKSHAVDEKKLRANYEKINAAMGKTEYKAQHILVADEKTATDIIAQLKKGGKFADLAKKHSVDPGSKERGGELGWAPASSYVPGFAEALKQLKKGSYTQTPVKTDFGYHVVFLEDTRPLVPPAFERVKPELQLRAQNELVDELIKDLRSKAKVE